jgi:ubiquinone biosynthesis accessory factor UbiK
MVERKVLDEIGAKIKEVIASSPARDIENNLRAMLAAQFARLNLVTREEFEVQSAVLARTREKLTQLEAKLAQLESSVGIKDRGSNK